MKFFTTSSGLLNSTSLRYLPVAHGTQSESGTISDSTIDQVNFIIPFDLRIDKIYINLTRQSNADDQPGHTKVSLWKAGIKYSQDVIVLVEGAGYDTFDLHNVYMWDFTNEPNTYIAGEIMQVSIHGENRLYNHSTTIIGEYL